MSTYRFIIHELNLYVIIFFNCNAFKRDIEIIIIIVYAIVLIIVMIIIIVT